MRARCEIKIGTIFGKWTVVGTAEPHPNRKGSKRWLCRCTCGLERIVNALSLRSKETRSCGKGICHTGFEDLTNKRFGKWTVIGLSFERKGRSFTWDVKCDCGNIGLVATNVLKRGDSQCCGMGECRYNYSNLVGQRFGKLVVTSFSHMNVHSFWNTKCDCGEVSRSSASNLRMGNVKSCGCLKREINSLPTGEAAFRQLYRTYSRGAKNRGYVFELSEYFFKDIVIKNCYYCSKPPSKTIKTPNGLLIYNGIDRVDNDLGYIEDNVVPCCLKCNMEKSTFSIRIAKKMVEFLDSKAKRQELVQY